MKKLILVVAIMGTILTGCAIPKADGYQENTGRFALALDEGTHRIYVDTETGVMYYHIAQGYRGGLTVMVDTDGKPLIWGENRHG